MTLQPLAAPLTPAQWRSPAESARCGGSSQDPCEVRTCTSPLSTQNSWPRTWLCQSYSREPSR